MAHKEIALAKVGSLYQVNLLRDGNIETSYEKQSHERALDIITWSKWLEVLCKHEKMECLDVVIEDKETVVRLRCPECNEHFQVISPLDKIAVL